MDDDPLADKSGVVAPDGTTLGNLLANVQFHGVVANHPSPQFTTIPALQGPPGPMPDLSDLPIPGTIQQAEISFVVDGWEYRFDSIRHARRVRDKLMEMTLEGEL